MKEQIGTVRAWKYAAAVNDTIVLWSMKRRVFVLARRENFCNLWNYVLNVGNSDTYYSTSKLLYPRAVEMTGCF